MGKEHGVRSSVTLMNCHCNDSQRISSFFMNSYTIWKTQFAKNSILLPSSYNTGITCGLMWYILSYVVLYGV